MLVGIGVVALMAISIYLAGAPKRKAQAAFRDQVIGLRVAISEGLNIGAFRNRKKELLTFFEINRASLVKSKAVFDKMDIFLSAALFFWEESISHPGRDHAFDDERVWIQLIGEPLPGKFGSSESGLGDSGLLTPMSYRNIALKKVTEQAQALIILLN